MRIRSQIIDIGFQTSVYLGVIFVFLQAFGFDLRINYTILYWITISLFVIFGIWKGIREGFFWKTKRLYKYTVRKNKRFIDICHSLFAYFLIGYLILLLLEEFSITFISSRINIDIVLVLVIILGVITAILPEQKRKKKKTTKWDYILVSALGLIGGVLICIKTKDLGWLSYVISSISSVLIILVGVLIYEEE